MCVLRCHHAEKRALSITVPPHDFLSMYQFIYLSVCPSISISAIYVMLSVIVTTDHDLYHIMYCIDDLFFDLSRRIFFFYSRTRCPLAP